MKIKIPINKMVIIPNVDLTYKMTDIIMDSDRKIRNNLEINVLMLLKMIKRLPNTGPESGPAEDTKESRIFSFVLEIWLLVYSAHPDPSFFKNNNYHRRFSAV